MKPRHSGKVEDDEDDTALWMILLMEEILHQLVGSLSHYLQGLYIPGGALL